METWKDVKGYEGLYQVSNLGRVRSLGRICNGKSNSVNRKRSRILTQEVTRFGYCRVRLYSSDGISKHYQTHRMVVEAFIRPLKNDEQVNHINEIKTDNRLENLEICNAEYNCNYGMRNAHLSEKNKQNKHLWCKAVIQKNKDGEIIARYDSRLDASKATGVDDSHIAYCCSGKRRTAGGFIWENEEQL